MTNKFPVDINKLLSAIEYFDYINSLDLESIEWIQNGIPVNIESSVAKNDWKYTGLNNVTYFEFSYQINLDQK